ncbi:hypothetical protein FRB99_004839, partial [Tulasnella sp. 403]
MSSPTRREQRKTLVRKVFEECWDEFYQWKYEYCRRELALLNLQPFSIKLELERDSLSTAGFSSADESTAAESNDENPTVEEGRTDEFEEYHIVAFSTNPNGSQPVPQISTQRVPVTDISERIGPVPPYEACVPLMANITLDDTTFERGIVSYIPYANEPEFLKTNRELADRTEFFLGWELHGRNPDVDIIGREAITRLCFEHDLTPEDIWNSEALLEVNLIQGDGSLLDPRKTR